MRIVRLVLMLLIVVGSATLLWVLYIPSVQTENRTTTIDFNNWLVTCQQSVERSSLCVMSQRVLVEESRSKISEIQFTYDLTNGGYELTALMPLGVMISPGLDIELDGQKRTQLQYKQCTENGCTATLRVSRELMQVFTQADAGHLIAIHKSGSTLALPIILDDFEQASQTLRRDTIAGQSMRWQISHSINETLKRLGLAQEMPADTLREGDVARHADGNREQKKQAGNAAPLEATDHAD